MPAYTSEQALNGLRDLSTMQKKAVSALQRLAL